MDIPNVKQALGFFFESRPEIDVAFLFGSMATGRNNALSDIDIALLVDRDKIRDEEYPYGYKAHVLADLIGLLKTNDVDLVLLDEAGTLLKHRVLYFGKLLFCRNETRRIRFQVE